MNSIILPVDASKVKFAIVWEDGINLGRCYNQTNLRVYSQDNVDDTQWDSVRADEDKSHARRQKLLEFLPRANAGSELGKFEPVKGVPGLWVAKYWYRTDSSD